MDSLTNKYSALVETEGEPVEALEPSNVLSQASRLVAEKPNKPHVRETGRAQKPSSWMEIHRSLGHCSDSVMRKTLPDVFIPEKESCKSCLTGKASRNRVPGGTRPRKILETISIDLEGPFRLKFRWRKYEY